jgi:small multidrug resistance pump
MHWLFLYSAILCEVAGVTSMKLSKGFTVLIPSILTLALYPLSLGCLILALRSLQVGLAYAIWSGLGTSLVTLIGIFYFRDPVSALKIASLLMVIAGVVGLNLSSTSH